MLYLAVILTMLMGLEARKYKPIGSEVDPSKVENEANPARLPGQPDISISAIDQHDPTKTVNEENPLPLPNKEKTKVGIQMPEPAPNNLELVLEDVDTVKDRAASQELADSLAAEKLKADLKSAAEGTLDAPVLGTAYGGHVAEKEAGVVRDPVVESTENVASLDEKTAEAGALELAKKKFNKKLETSSKESVLMSLEAELENKQYELEDAEEEGNKSLIGNIKRELKALRSVQSWIEKDEYKNAA